MGDLACDARTMDNRPPEPGSQIAVGARENALVTDRIRSKDGRKEA